MRGLASWSLALCLVALSWRSSSQAVSDFPSLRPLDALLNDTQAAEADCLNMIETLDDAELRGAHTRLALGRGWWDCGAGLLKRSVHAGVRDVESEFSLATQLIKRQLSQLKLSIDGAKATQVVNPAFEWAQSPSEVFLNVKFAHKLDAPATLDVKVQNVTLGDDRVYVYAEKGSKHFELDLGLSGAILPDTSSWQLGSVGRCSFTLAKAERSKWPRLLQEGSKRPQNMHTWWTMQEQYDDELDDLEEAAETARRTAAREKKKAAAASSTSENAERGDTDPSGDELRPPDANIGEGPDEGADAELSDEAKAEAAAAAELREKERTLRQTMEGELKQKLKDVEARRKAEIKALDKDFDARKAEINAEAKTKREAAEANAKAKRRAADDKFAADKAELRETSAKDIEAAVKALSGTKQKKGFNLFGREL